MKDKLFKLSAIAMGCLCITFFSSMRHENLPASENISTALPVAKVSLCQFPTSTDGKYTYKVSKKDLISLGEFCLEGMPKGKITSYRITIMPVNGYMEEMTSSNNKIDGTARHLISKLNAGDMIVIESIKVTDGATGEVRKMAPISILLI